MDNNRVWISWERQRRTMVLSREFNCQLFLYDKKHKNRLTRYVFAIISTLSFLVKKKPKIVFCQNPSIVLASLLCLFKVLFKYKLVVDRHSNFMLGRKVDLKYKLFMLLSNYTIRHSDITIITNRHLKRYVDSKGGNGVILQDKIPSIYTEEKIDMKGEFNIFFVASFAVDEPIDEFFESISDIDSKFFFYISGNFRKYRRELDERGENYELTGFVSEQRYAALMSSVNAVMVFTKNKFTLTCGAYEGLSCGKPLILTGTDTIKEYFSAGAVYCEMNRDSISAGIYSCYDNYEGLKNESVVFKEKLLEDWYSKFSMLEEDIRLLLKSDRNGSDIDVS